MLLLTLVVIVIHELFSCNHVEQLQYSALLSLARSLGGQAANGRDAHIEVGDLGWANARLGHLQLMTSHVHAIQRVQSRLVGSSGVKVFGECNSLENSQHV